MVFLCINSFYNFFNYRTEKKKRKKQIKVNIVFIVLLLGTIFFNFATVQMDIINNNTVMMQYTSASYHPEGNPQFLVKPYWFENDNKVVELSIVTNVPKGLKNGTVIYSKYSRVLLEYSGTTIERW